VISSPKVLVNNKTTVVDKTIVVDGLENVGVNVSVTTSDQNTALNLKLILLALFLLFLVAVAVAVHLGALIVVNEVGFIVHAVAVVDVVGLRFLIDVHLFFLLFLVGDVELLKHDFLEVAVVVVLNGSLLLVEAGAG